MLNSLKVKDTRKLITGGAYISTTVFSAMSLLKSINISFMYKYIMVSLIHRRCLSKLQIESGEF